MSDCVIDTSVVLAFVFNEPGRELAGRLFPGSLISTVNLAEFVTKLTARGMSEAQIQFELTQLNLTSVPFDSGLAIATGLLRTATSCLGLSLGDRACLGLALREKLPVYTADRAWAGLDLGVEIRLLR